MGIKAPQVRRTFFIYSMQRMDEFDAKTLLLIRVEVCVSTNISRLFY